MAKKTLIIVLFFTIFLGSCDEKVIEEVTTEKIDYGEALDIEIDKEELREYKKSVIKARYKNSRIILTAVGDIMVGRRVGRILEDRGTDVAYKNLDHIFKKTDILFGNLESPISNKGKKLPGKGICLRAKPEMIDILKGADFNILSLANNHILDYDTEALLDTFKILEENNVAYVGAGEDINEARKPYITNVKGKTFAFLAYDEFAYIYYSNSYKRRFVATKEIPGTAPLKLDMILEDVEKIRDNVDYVVVSLHWGVEESSNITKDQREYAHELIDKGVDVILGHHPHVIQPIEIYKGRPIVYSMGNYIFDQNDEKNKQGMVIEVSIEDGEIRELGAIPIYILNKSEPIIASDRKGDLIKNKIIKLSQRLDTLGKIEENRVVFQIE